MASERARELADAIEAINLELIQLVRGCSAEQGRTVCNDEGDDRTVGVIAHHVGHGHFNTAEWIAAAVAGKELIVTPNEMDAENAEHAASYHDVGREDTIQLLTDNGERLSALVAALTDEELARTAYHGLAGRELTVAGYAEWGRRHVSGHLATIRKALDLEGL